jgi:hypothetical protein
MPIRIFLIRRGPTSCPMRLRRTIPPMPDVGPEEKDDATEK